VLPSVAEKRRWHNSSAHAQGIPWPRVFREERGIRIPPDCAEPPSWRRDVSYTYRGARRLQNEIMATVHLREAAPIIEGSQRLDFESDDHFGSRWWTVDEIVSSSALLPQKSASASSALPRRRRG